MRPLRGSPSVHPAARHEVLEVDTSDSRPPSRHRGRRAGGGRRSTGRRRHRGPHGSRSSSRSPERSSAGRSPERPWRARRESAEAGRARRTITRDRNRGNGGIARRSTSRARPIDKLGEVHVVRARAWDTAPRRRWRRSSEVVGTTSTRAELRASANPGWGAQGARRRSAWQPQGPGAPGPPGAPHPSGSGRAEGVRAHPRTRLPRVPGKAGGERQRPPGGHSRREVGAVRSARSRITVGLSELSSSFAGHSHGHGAVSASCGRTGQQARTARGLPDAGNLGQQGRPRGSRKARSIERATRDAKVGASRPSRVEQIVQVRRSSFSPRLTRVWRGGRGSSGYRRVEAWRSTRGAEGP